MKYVEIFKYAFSWLCKYSFFFFFDVQKGRFGIFVISRARLCDIKRKLKCIRADKTHETDII